MQVGIYYRTPFSSAGKDGKIKENRITLKSNEDMILALAGQFKQLSHEPEKFR